VRPHWSYLLHQLEINKQNKNPNKKTQPIFCNHKKKGSKEEKRRKKEGRKRKKRNKKKTKKIRREERKQRN